MVFSSTLFAFSDNYLIWLVAGKVFISFCLISSSIYLLNDSIDKKSDKKHPQKKFRPIASGQVNIKSAICLSLFLAAVSFLIGVQIKNSFVILLIIYYIIQVLYCFYLKKVAIIELFCVASGFILRAISGAVAANISISPWFILSVGMLSLFLVVEKRKAEIFTFKNDKNYNRVVLESYSLPLINKFESVLTSSTVITYSLWAFGPLIGGAKSQWMILTIPLVLLGIFRYQMLSEKFNKLDSNSYKINLLETPENVIKKDKPMLVIIISWLIFTLFIGLIG